MSGQQAQHEATSFKAAPSTESCDGSLKIDAQQERLFRARLHFLDEVAFFVASRIRSSTSKFRNCSHPLDPLNRLAAAISIAHY
jgi:hypothetical protein